VFRKDPKSPTPQSQKEAGSADLFYLPKMIKNFYTGHRCDEFEASIQVITGKEQDSLWKHQLLALSHRMHLQDSWWISAPLLSFLLT
jgi:hypothetical protein